LGRAQDAFRSREPELDDLLRWQDPGDACVLSCAAPAARKPRLVVYLMFCQMTVGSSTPEHRLSIAETSSVAG